MAKGPPDKKRQREKSREAYMRQYEQKRADRAKKTGRTSKPVAFDPERFVEQIRMQSWATIHTVIYSAAVTAACIFAGRAAGAQAVGAFAALLLIGTVFPYLLRVWDIDLRKLGRATSVVGVFLVYFVAWLAVCFLAANPPLSDDAPPEIVCCGAYEWNVTNASWVHIPGTLEQARINTTNGTGRVEFGVFDNSGVRRVTLDVIATSAWPTLELPVAANGVYDYDFTNLTRGAFYLTIRAFDGAEHTTQHTFSLTACTFDLTGAQQC
jgi:hypothetical protein